MSPVFRLKRFLDEQPVSWENCMTRKGEEMCMSSCKKKQKTAASLSSAKYDMSGSAFINALSLLTLALLLWLMGCVCVCVSAGGPQSFRQACSVLSQHIVITTPSRRTQCLLPLPPSHVCVFQEEHLKPQYTSLATSGSVRYSGLIRRGTLQRPAQWRPHSSLCAKF